MFNETKIKRTYKKSMAQIYEMDYCESGKGGDYLHYVIGSQKEYDILRNLFLIDRERTPVENAMIELIFTRAFERLSKRVDQGKEINYCQESFIHEFISGEISLDFRPWENDIFILANKINIDNLPDCVKQFESDKCLALNKKELEEYDRYSKRKVRNLLAESKAYNQYLAV